MSAGEKIAVIGAGLMGQGIAQAFAQAGQRIVEELGLQVATPDEAREILALKGADRVNF